MWQKIDDKYHFVLIEDDEVVKDGDKALTICEQTVAVQSADQVDYVMDHRECCEFCDQVTDMIFTSVDEAIRHALPRVTRVDVLSRTLGFTNSVTLKKALVRKIRKLEKA